MTHGAGRELPAEVMVQVNEGADYGWPTCYYDGGLKQNVLAPEYGGDGKNRGRLREQDAAGRGLPRALGTRMMW